MGCGVEAGGGGHHDGGGGAHETEARSAVLAGVGGLAYGHFSAGFFRHATELGGQRVVVG